MISHPTRSFRTEGESLDDMLVATCARRVLLAEDDPDMRQLLATVLTADGCQVIEARDGHELLSRIGSQLLSANDAIAVDLIISDVRMPGRSGLEVLAGLRKADWATPFILLTAFGSQELHREANRLGAAAVFDKPFEIDKLRAAVLNLMPPDRPRGAPASIGHPKGRRER